MSFKRSNKSRCWLLLIIILLAAGCGQQTGTEIKAHMTPTTDKTNTPPTSSPPEPTIQPVTPTAAPSAINPLTGLEVADPSLLDLPAVLVSISTFPAIARPQSGLSFAPYVFEFYITKGSTRFLAAFYGEFPAPEIPGIGDCEVRREPFNQTDLMLGNRVWLDENKNNLQDDWERGVSGVCVSLFDANDNLLAQTSTDSNGYYGFNVGAGVYSIAAENPGAMEFTQANAGDEEKDSDVDQATGRSDALDVTSPLLHLDIGLVPPETPSPILELPPARVGPVRSGRLIYRHIARFFEDSCLIYAYASYEVLEKLPYCAFVDHNIQGGGYMLDVSEMVGLANERMDTTTSDNYASNIFSSAPPEGGAPAAKLDVFYAWLNQTGWVYDPLSQSWWRYVDESNEKTAGILHPEIDRLTGRQLQFENVVVLFARHEVISPTNLDIRLDRGRIGKGYLFRDGRIYTIQWSVEDDAPIQFQYEDGNPFPLKPGKTWVTVVTLATTVTEKKPGEWFVRFYEPSTSE